MAVHPFGIASIVFLVLYSILFFLLAAGYAARRFQLKSRWSLLFCHVLIRLGAQGVGVGLDQYGIRTSTGLDLLMATITLSAEGYLTLVICMMCQAISWQKRAAGHSWLHGKSDKSYLKLNLKEASQSPGFVIDVVLGLANVLVIVGGLIPLTLEADEVVEAWQTNAPTIRASKALKGSGQGVFLAITIFVVMALWYDAFVTSKRASSSLRKELSILLVAVPFILARGTFGLAQALDSRINFAGPYIYSGDYGGSFRVGFVIQEAVLATAMEWLTCACLLATAIVTQRKGSQRDAPVVANADSEMSPDVENKVPPSV